MNIADVAALPERSVAGQNLANINTPGYSRQRVILETNQSIQTGVGMEGTGASVQGIEQIVDTLLNGKIQTQEGATAKLTFGPSPFDSLPAHVGLFVVVYDKSGINGIATPGKPGQPLPEPMCAPEGVLARLADLGERTTTLRYALDADQRPMWLATSTTQPSAAPRLFDPQDCHLRGVPARRKLR